MKFPKKLAMKTQSQVERYKQTEICKHVNLGNSLLAEALFLVFVDRRKEQTPGKEPLLAGNLGNRRNYNEGRDEKHQR